MSDLSVFHRVDDVAALAISRFIMLADRLAAYAGAVRARLTLQPAEVASAVGTPAPSGTAAARGSGDTPPEVVRQMKLAQFAARHQKLKSKPGQPAAPIDPASIVWDDNQVLAEIKRMGG